MIHLPSALELELLSDQELDEKISEVVKILTVKQKSEGDDRDEQELYQILETERKRRQTLANKIDI